MATPDFDPDCLHCALSKTLHEFVMERIGQTDADGEQLVSSEMILTRLAEVQADVILSIDPAAERAEMVRIAHEALDQMMAERAGLPETSLLASSVAH